MLATLRQQQHPAVVKSVMQALLHSCVGRLQQHVLEQHVLGPTTVAAFALRVLHCWLNADNAPRQR